ATAVRRRSAPPVIGRFGFCPPTGDACASCGPGPVSTPPGDGVSVGSSPAGSVGSVGPVAGGEVGSPGDDGSVGGPRVGGGVSVGGSVGVPSVIPIVPSGTWARPSRAWAVALRH